MMLFKTGGSLSDRKIAGMTAISIILLTVGILLLMGRTPFGPTGIPGFWSGDVQSQSNSQYFLDAYTFTHISHGLALYLILWFFFPKMSVLRRFILAVGIESAWEILENTDYTIQRYREVTISLNYYGDSLLNTIGDLFAMIAGFIFAHKVSAKWSWALFILMEVLLAVIIRDNLILNIVTLLFPLPAVIRWQIGG